MMPELSCRKAGQSVGAASYLASWRPSVRAGQTPAGQAPALQSGRAQQTSRMMEYRDRLSSQMRAHKYRFLQELRSTIGYVKTLKITQSFV